MHREIWDWLRQTRHEHPALFSGGRVLECGASIVNYTARGLFPLSEYVGIDVHPGAGVDVVTLVHDYEAESPFDVVVSTQMLEHDPYWRESVAAMVKALKPGGALLLTYASPNCPRHGDDDSPTAGYFGGRTAADVTDIIGPHFDSIEATEKGIDVFILAHGRRLTE